jgi:membrane protein DedA with SNARE-associated domain
VNQTAEFVIRHGYALLFFWIFAEQGALPLPSIPLLLVCGALIRAGHLNSMLVLLSGGAACLIADGVWFQLGRSRGRKILGFLCRVALEPDSCVRQTENGFARYGVRFLLVSKFIPGMNALAGPLAGSSGVSWPRFLLFDIAGAILWIASWGAVGFIFSEQLDAVGHLIGQAGFRLALFIAVLVGGWIGWKYFKRHRFLRRLEKARITAGELDRMLRDGEEIFVIDVRGHGLPDNESIEGAVRIPLEDLASRRKEIPRDRDIILFCT